MAKSKEKPVVKKPRSKNVIGDSAMTTWFEKNYSRLCISVLVLAGVLRLLLLFELPNMPFNQLHQATDLDMHFFDQWGDRIAQGDILTDTVWHPYHSWHAHIASSLGLEDKISGQQKWNEWYGGKKYHQEPLYPLLVGVAKMITSDGRLLMYIFQMLLGLVSIWMVMWLGRHYFGAMAGILGGLIFTLYSPNLLFEAALLRTSLSTTLLLSLIYVAEKMYTGKGKPFLFGILGGIGYILMATSILLWIPLFIRWVYLRRNELINLWKVVAGFLIIISFLIMRNSIVGVPLFSASSVGPVTYVCSNFPTYEPELGFAYFLEAGQIMESSGGQMLPAALGVIQLHKSVWNWVFLQIKKLGAVFHWYEIPNNINSYLAAKMSFALRLAFIPYSIIAALGLMGIWMNLKNGKAFSLYVAVLSQVAIMVIFYVLCRFRIPMVAMMAIFAGYTLQRLASLQTVKQIMLTCVGAIALFIFVIRPIPRIPVPFEKGDVTTYFQAYFLPRLQSLEAKGDLAGCTVLLEKLINTMPGSFRKINSISELSSQKEKDLASFYGILCLDESDLYTNMGNTQASNKYKLLGQKLKGPDN